MKKEKPNDSKDACPTHVPNMKFYLYKRRLDSVTRMWGRNGQCGFHWLKYWEKTPHECLEKS